MSEATHLVSPEALSGDRLTVDGEAYRHLFRSRRLAVGDRLRLVDGEGRARWGAIESVDRRSAVVALGEPAPVLEPARELEFFVALPKPERASWLVEKLTEMGVRRLCWVMSERAPREAGRGVLERQRRIAIAALEQSGGARLPRIEGPLPWLAALDAGAADSVVLVPTGSTDPPAPRVLRAWIGPEGGFTTVELADLESRGSRAFSLGPRILRIETAAVAAAARLLAP